MAVVQLELESELEIFSLAKAPLTIQSSKVLESNLTVSPHSRDDGIDFLPLQSSVSNPQELSLNNKRQSSFVHIDHNWKEFRWMKKFNTWAGFQNLRRNLSGTTKVSSELRVLGYVSPVWFLLSWYTLFLPRSQPQECSLLPIKDWKSRECYCFLNPLRLTW